MAEILKEWLSERLQRPVTWEPSAFGDMMKNGLVVADLLLSYHVINADKHYLMRSGNDPADIKNNWQYIAQWLHELDINLQDSEQERIMEGNGSALLRMFYQLFLRLDRKDRTDFIKEERQKVSKLVEKLGHRFKVDRIPDEEDTFVDELSKPLLNEAHFIEWQRKKTEQVKDTYDYMRHKYSKMVKKIKETSTSTCFEPAKSLKLSVRDRKDMDKFALSHPCKFTNYSYEQLLELEKKALEQKSSISGTEWAKNYMNNLHSRINKRSDSEKFQKQLSNVLSGSIWDMSIAEEETKLDTELAKKVMKLSQFEKQMCTQLMETKQQSRNLFQNRAQAEKEFSEQRTQQFNQFLDNIKEKLQSQVTEIDLEKQRQDALHKKLYAEKMARKRRSYYEICYDTVLSLIDYSTKYGYFKKLLEGDIPNHFIHEWKNLFYRQQPIFDIVDPIENILEKHDEDEMTPEVEEIIRLELDRQEALNSTEFIEYHNYTPPWCLDLLLPNYNPESEERKYESLGMRILGHVVYTLLEIKYPYPPPRPPADLPDYASKALLCGLPDRSITEQMQILLNTRKIHVVRLERAINFCLRKFKTEMVGCTDIDLSFDKFTANSNEEQDKELIKLIKTEDDLTYKASDLALSLMLGVIAANTKQTQTPKTLPEEDISLSAAASLGKYTYETLNSGDTLTDHLLAAMVVEYLKDQDNINGFVLINYPNSYREAQILEETFLGIAPPDDWQLDDRDDVYLEESIIKHRKKEIDQYKDVRVSKLVDNPHKRKSDKPFESYFTCYISLKPTEDILQEVFIWDLNELNSELIDRFYALLGINYSMYYEIIDKELLAQICKYIIGDLMPDKSYDSLFGENVLSMLEFTTSEAKGAKSKIVKPEVSSVSNDKFRETFVENSQMSKSAMAHRLEVVIKSPSKDDLSEKLSIHEEFKSLSNLEDIKLLAGEEDWEYGDLPIAHPIGVALANCWIEAENAYIKDMTELFFAKRLQMNCLVPYARFIKDKMDQIITLPSNKQDIVSSFQKDYNEFENDWRDVNLVKNEWHCRVMELQNKLYNICDQRKLFAEKQRQLLICDNWAMEELTSMANTYISCMQTELNRSIMTYQIFHDFYFAMIKHLPQNDRLSSKDLNKIYRDNDDASPSGSKKGSEDKLYRLLKVSYQDMHMKNIEIDYSNNPFNVVIENNVKVTLKIIKDTNDTYRSLIAREYSEIAKIQPSSKKKDESPSEESVQAEDIFRENALKCIEEWTMGINGEMYRATLRMLALQYKCYHDMRLFNEHIYKTFTEIQNDIDTYYSNEIKSVDRLSKYLQMAIENGRKIPETLVLEHDKFIIDPNLLQYAPAEGPTVTEKPPETKKMNFTLRQLANLRSQFKIVSPSGIILQQAFIYLLQDFIFFGKESCAGSMFPEEWKLIDPEQLPKLVLVLFGDTVYVDWRDFLIYCLNVRIPTVEELLDVRTKFRCKDLDSTELISREDFLNEELWFEEDFDPECNQAQLRKNLVKHFLFELFETDEDIMNYSAFLLAFCKSVNPIEGFATALSMAVGKKTCYLLDECEEVVCKLIKNKKYKDACRACALKCAGQFLNILLNRVVNNCEAVAISELQYIPPAEEKNIKGKKGGKPTKKDISARMSRISASTSIAKSKVSLSASNVKTTYICPPCGEKEPIEKEEKKEEKKKEELEEEFKIELEKDPNLAYSVSQSAIWNVLRICLPWHFELLPETKNTPYVDQVTELLKRLESDTDNGDIYVCRFVSDPNICKLLHKVKRFTIVSLPEEIEKLYV